DDNKESDTYNKMITLSRGYGFDFSGSARGERFEKNVTFGHTGYTGTMYWIDPVNQCFVILLTNRVNPDDSKPSSKAIIKLRKTVSTLAADALLGPTDAPPPANDHAFTSS